MLSELDGERPNGRRANGLEPRRESPGGCVSKANVSCPGAASRVSTRATVCRFGSTRVRRPTSIEPADFAIGSCILPRGGGSARLKSRSPINCLINRAREKTPDLCEHANFKCSQQVEPKTGTSCRRLRPAETLGGYDPEGQPRLGFTYQVLDRERGLQTFSLGDRLPVRRRSQLLGRSALGGVSRLLVQRNVFSRIATRSEVKIGMLTKLRIAWRSG